MKAVEFEGALNPDATLTVPTEIAQLVPRDHPLLVLLLIPENDEADEWRRVTAEHFLRGYSDGDAIYDNLQPG